MRIRTLFTVLLASLSSACGSDKPTGIVAGGNAQCSGTMSAPQAYEFTCSTNAGLTTATGNTTITIGQSNNTNIATAVVSITSATALHTGTYTNTTAGMSGLVSLQSGTKGWLTSTNTGTNAGTFTLKIDKITVLQQLPAGTSYLIDGSLDATLPAIAGTGTTGTVTAHVAFKYN